MSTGPGRERRTVLRRRQLAREVAAFARGFAAGEAVERQVRDDLDQALREALGGDAGQGPR